MSIFIYNNKGNNMKIKFIIIIILNLLFVTSYIAQVSNLPNYPSTKKVSPIVTSYLEKDSNYFNYSYSVWNAESAKQKIWNLLVEIKSSNFSTEQPYFWKMNYFKRDSVKAISWFSIDSLKDIKTGAFQDSFHIISTGLPIITKYYAVGWLEPPEGEEYIQHGSNDIFKNSFKGKTLGPKDPTDPYIPIEFIDTLKTYTDSSYALGWIKTEQTKDKYNNYFTNAKNYLNQNNNNAAKTELQKVLTDCNADSSTVLTSEAYALLYFNTDYLINQIPEGKTTK